MTRSAVRRRRWARAGARQQIGRRRGRRRPGGPAAAAPAPRPAPPAKQRARAQAQARRRARQHGRVDGADPPNRASTAQPKEPHRRRRSAPAALPPGHRCGAAARRRPQRRPCRHPPGPACSAPVRAQRSRLARSATVRGRAAVPRPNLGRRSFRPRRKRCRNSEKADRTRRGGPRTSPADLAQGAVAVGLKACVPNPQAPTARQATAAWRPSASQSPTASSVARAWCSCPCQLSLPTRHAERETASSAGAYCERAGDSAAVRRSAPHDVAIMIHGRGNDAAPRASSVPDPALVTRTMAEVAERGQRIVSEFLRRQTAEGAQHGQSRPCPLHLLK